MRPTEDGGAAEEMVAELRAIRPRPSQHFKSELDARAAEGFPPRRRGHGPVADTPAGSTANADDDRRPGRRDAGSVSWRHRLRGLRLAPILAGATAMVAVITAIAVTDLGGLGESGGNDSADSGFAVTAQTDSAEPAPDAAQSTGGSIAMDSDRQQQYDEAGDGTRLKAGGVVDAGLSRSNQFSRAGTTANSAENASEAGSAKMLAPSRSAGGPVAGKSRERVVERDASIVLATEPADVDEVAAGVLRVANAHQGIVLNSSTRAGAEGEAGAEFSLKIPAGQLAGALAELSDLAPVRSRVENANDITAPTVSVTDRLRAARAEVRGLLKQLTVATTEAEREAIKIDLAPAQRRVARLRSQLDRLERRAHFATVHVSVLTGEDGIIPGDDGWSLGDAVDDAVEVLTVTAGIVLIATAALLPLGLLALIAALIRRSWVRRDRERALREDNRPPQRSGDQPS